MTDHHCDKCHIRKMYAKRFDLHIWGEDCPYVCPKYDKWKKEKINEKSNPRRT